MIPFAKPTVFKRRKPPKLEKGIMVESDEVQEIRGQANIQPMSIEEIKALPEGKDFNEQIHIFTDTAIQAAGKDSSSLGDYVIYRGQTFQIYTVLEWDEPQPHFEAYASLVDEDI